MYILYIFENKVKISFMWTEQPMCSSLPVASKKTAHHPIPDMRRFREVGGCMDAWFDVRISRLFLLYVGWAKVLLLSLPVKPYLIAVKTVISAYYVRSRLLNIHLNNRLCMDFKGITNKTITTIITVQKIIEWKSKEHPISLLYKYYIII